MGSFLKRNIHLQPSTRTSQVMPIYCLVTCPLFSILTAGQYAFWFQSLHWPKSSSWSLSPHAMTATRLETFRG